LNEKHPRSTGILECPVVQILADAVKIQFNAVPFDEHLKRLKFPPLRLVTNHVSDDLLAFSKGFNGVVTLDCEAKYPSINRAGAEIIRLSRSKTLPTVKGKEGTCSG
jgi:hypothetical protein